MASPSQEQSADLFGENTELKYKTAEEIKENVGQTPYSPTLKELGKDLYTPASFLPVLGTGIAIKEMPEVAKQAYDLLKQGKSESDLVKMGLGVGLGILVAADVIPYAKKVTDPLKSKIKNVAEQTKQIFQPQAITPEGISVDIPKVDSKILKNEVVDYYRKKGGASRKAQEEVDDEIFSEINYKHRIPKHELLKDKKGEPLKLYMGLQNPTKLGDKFKHTFGKKDPFSKRRDMAEGQKPIGFASSNPLLADGFASRYLRNEDMKYNVFSGQNVVPFYVKPKKVIEYKPLYDKKGNMESSANWFKFDKQALTMPDGHVLVWRDGIEQHTRVIPELKEAIPNVKFNQGDVYAFGENVPVFSALSGKELTDVAPKPIPSWMLNQSDRSRYIEQLKQMKQDSPVLKKILARAEEISFTDMGRIIGEGINKGLNRKGIRQLLQDRGFDDNMITKYYDEVMPTNLRIKTYANEPRPKSFFDEDEIREEFAETTQTNPTTGFAESNKFLNEFAPIKDKKNFNKGGIPMKRQMEMFQDGGLEQDGGTVDPVSGNDVPMGSAQKEVRDDIPAQLSEGEFVFPADVVRFIGLERLMEIRQRAKAGLKKMEAMGQMGNSEEATIPDDIPFTIDDLEMEEEEEVSAYKGGTVKLENGGTPYVAPTIAEVPTATAPETIPTPEEFIPSVADEYREYVNDEGHVIDVPYFRGSILPGYNLPAGYRLKEQETVSTEQDITDTAMLDIVDKDRDATSPENMQKAREDMNRSYDNVVSQVMQDNPGASLEEITKKIKGGESTINIFGKKINAPGFLFNEDEITAAYDRAFSGPVIDDEADIVPEEPKRRGTLIATDKKGKVTDDVAPSSAKSLNMTESENKAIKEAAAKQKAIQEEKDKRQEEKDAASAARARTKVSKIFEKQGGPSAKELQKGTKRRFKEGGIASKPKKKKAMKRGGLASKK